MPPTGVNVDVALIAPAIGDEEFAAVERVLRSGRLAQGPEVAAFEGEFASALGGAHAVAMNSGTAAVHAGLAAFGVGPGQDVVTTPFTFAATATPIAMLGARPRFADIDPRTFLLDSAALLEVCSPATTAAVVVDLFGLPIEPALAPALRARGVRVLEDAAQAVGGARAGVPAGRLAGTAAFSFYATKNLTTGEGGMLVTEDVAVADFARRFRSHGESARYEHESLGYNFRMTEIAAALGRAGLQRLDALQTARRSNAAFYAEELGDVPGLTLPYVPPDTRHAYHQFCVLVDPERTPSGCDRDAFRAALREAGIETGLYYAKPLHLQPVFAKLGYARGDFPVAERVAGQIVALPVHPRLDRGQLEHVVRVARRVAGGSP